MHTVTLPPVPEAVGVETAVSPRIVLPALDLPGVTDADRAFVAELKVRKEESVRFAVRRLLSLRDTGKHVYRNTVSAKDIAHRRARGKVAKASRKANR